MKNKTKLRDSYYLNVSDILFAGIRIDDYQDRVEIFAIGVSPFNSQKQVLHVFKKNPFSLKRRSQVSKAPSRKRKDKPSLSRSKRRRTPLRRGK